MLICLTHELFITIMLWQIRNLFACARQIQSIISLFIFHPLDLGCLLQRIYDCVLFCNFKLWIPYPILGELNCHGLAGYQSQSLMMMYYKFIVCLMLQIFYAIAQMNWLKQMSQLSYTMWKDGDYLKTWCFTALWYIHLIDSSTSRLYRCEAVCHLSTWFTCKYVTLYATCKTSM